MAKGCLAGRNVGWKIEKAWDGRGGDGCDGVGGRKKRRRKGRKKVSMRDKRNSHLRLPSLGSQIADRLSFPIKLLLGIPHPFSPPSLFAAQFFSPSLWFRYTFLPSLRYHPRYSSAYNQAAAWSASTLSSFSFSAAREPNPVVTFT